MNKLEHLRLRLTHWQREDIGDLLAECDAMIVKLQLALRNAARNDKTEYRHHEPRRLDGMPPAPGTIWLTPREIARAALQEPQLATMRESLGDTP